jgi:hypothetical protein
MVMENEQVLWKAKAKVAEMLLVDYDATVHEEDRAWEVRFIRKGGMPGGGFRVWVAKDTLEVIRVLREQ